ncbi:MAG: TatD family hydrolase [Bacteroidetes bacterium]|nr:TatD family hydrolase [Bacteroidota bacterium]
MKSPSTVSFIDLHTHSLKEESDVFKIVNLFPEQIDQLINHNQSLSAYSIGWHPWYLKRSQMKSTMEVVNRASADVDVVAIGECGLDLLCDPTVSLQLSIFKEHALIAEAVKKPLIIHCVRAFNELIRLKKEIMPSIPWIIHGFNANQTIGKELIRHGFYFSLGKALLDETSNAAILLPEIANDHLFLETDDLDESIKIIYRQAALLMKVDLEETRIRVNKNYYTSFSIK